MRVDFFDFDLPRHLIAERPAQPRDSARLLQVAADRLEDRGVRDLPRLLAPNDILVVNDTKVIPARLSGHRGAAKVEVTLHQRLDGARWAVFARPAKRLKAGDAIDFGPALTALVEARGEGGEVILRFDKGDAALMAALDEIGRMPLPPYIRGGKADAADRADYQTVYASEAGAVAAPTAGLHFTPELLAALDAAGIKRVAATLHVGAGTFLPVTAEDTVDHRMHSEWGTLSADAVTSIEAARASGGRVVAVGTTALRLLESAAAATGKLAPFEGTTDIFITPGYRFRVVDLLLTNFHLPRSTLFMLVSAFSGLERMKAAYAHAVESGYRFYSYGDCCLLERNEES